MSSVDGSNDSPVRGRAPETSASPTVLVVLAVLTGVGVSVLGAADLRAQNLPSADELESEKSQTEEPFEETSSGQKESQEKSDEEKSEESADKSAGSGDDKADKSASGTSDGSGSSKQAASGQKKEGDSGQTESKAAEQGASKTQAAGKSEGKKKEEQAKKGETEGESSRQGEQSKEKGDEKRGKLINTETDTEKEVEGHGAVDGDVRWVQSGLNAYGVAGLQHAASAKPQKPNTYHVGFFGEVTGGSNMIRAQDQNTFVAGRMLIHAQIIEYFSANLSFGARNNVNNFGRPNAMLSQGDMTLGLRGHYSPAEYLHMAGDVTLDFPTGFGSAGMDFAGTSVRPRAMGTLELNPLIENLEFPMAAHLNIGYRVDNTQNTVPDNIDLTRVERFAHGISAFNAVELGLESNTIFPTSRRSPNGTSSFRSPGPTGFARGVRPWSVRKTRGLPRFRIRSASGCAVSRSSSWRCTPEST
ncbi:MAG: hypothetical protein ABEK29_00295 [Bradymonadaceae bacterium]